MSKILTLKVEGDYKKTERFLHGLIERHYMDKIYKYGEIGVQALSAATPVDSGKTAESWSYRVVEPGEGRLELQWINSNVNKHVNIAIILQYGHGTRNGGYVQGRDYINPAIQPIFDEMAKEVWREVVS